jgi:hypothetical protein
MRRAAGKLRRVYGVRGLVAMPTAPLRISAQAAAGAAPLSNSFMPEYDLPDPRSNATKLRDMFQSNELEFLMEAHVGAASLLLPLPRPGYVQQSRCLLIEKTHVLLLLLP